MTDSAAFFNEPSRAVRHAEDKLRKHGGRPALATVIAYNERFSTHNSGIMQQVAVETDHYTLTLRVEPDDEPAFETGFKDHATIFSPEDRPRVGDRLAVLYDPSDHSHVTRDTSLEGRTALNMALHPQGSTPATSADFLSAAPPPAMAAEPAAQLQQLADLHASGALSDDEFAAAKAKVLGS